MASEEKRNVYFEAGLKEGSQKILCSDWRPRTPLKVYVSDLDTESSWMSNSVVKAHVSKSSTGLTSKNHGSNSPLPLSFLFEHLSGSKNSIGEAMAVAQMSASVTPFSSDIFSAGGKHHSYTKLRRKRSGSSALKKMNYPAIVASLPHEDLSNLTTIPEDEDVDVSSQFPRKKRPVSLFGSRLRDPCRRHKSNRKKGGQGYMSGALKCRIPKNGRKITKSSGARNSASFNRKQKLMKTRPAARILKSWDVQAALGPLLHTCDQARLGDLKTPIVAESLNYCSDGNWRWKSCLLVGFDSSCGMYHALCDESIEDRCGSCENLSPPESSDTGASGSDSFWEFNSDSGCWKRTIKGDQHLPTRLVARLNLRLAPDTRAQSSDSAEHYGSCHPSLAVTGQRTGTIRAESPISSPPFNSRLSTRNKTEGFLPSGGTQGMARLGHELEFKPPSCYSAEGSVRQGLLASEISALNSRSALKPLNGVESRLGVGLSTGASEKSFSFRRVSVSGKSNPFTQPGEFELSENLLSWRKKQRPDSAKSIVYDVFPLLSELAREFEHAASIIESSDVTSLREAGMLFLDSILKPDVLYSGMNPARKGPRPVKVAGHSFAAHSSSLSASSALLRPGLQGAMLLVVDSVKLVERTRFLAISAPCVSIAKAVILQIEKIEESTDYIRKIVLADARDALNTALVRDEGLSNMKNGSRFYVRIARWANLLTETALANALEGTLEAYASRFDGRQTPLQRVEDHEHGAGPMFVVKLTVTDENKMDYRTPLSKLGVFSGKLLDDVMEALISLPFMDTKDSVHTKVERDVLRKAAVDALPLCRLRVSEAVAQATESMGQLHSELSEVWTDLFFFKRSVDMKAGNLIAKWQQFVCPERANSNLNDIPEDLSQESDEKVGKKSRKWTFFDQLDDFLSVARITLRKQRHLQSTFMGYHGKVVGTLFRVDFDEMIMQTSSLGMNCKEKVAEVLRDILRTTIQQQNQKLGADEMTLATPLSDLNPEKFAAVETVVLDYKVDPHPLHKSLEILKACHSALENFSLELDDEDVSAYWSLYGQAHRIFTIVASKENFLKDGKSIVVAAIRAKQAAIHIRVREVVSSIRDLESLKEVKEAFENEFLVKSKLESLSELKGDIEMLKTKEKLLNITENEECSDLITPAVQRVDHLVFLWTTVAEWIRNKDQWMQQRFQRLNVEHMFVMVQTFGEKLTKLVADTKSSSSQNVILSVADEVNEMLTKLPILVRLRHPGVRRVHWIELASRTGCMAFLDAGEVLNLKSVLELPLFSSYQETIWTVLERAAEEYNQEVCLEKMEAEMRGVVLELSPRNESNRQVLQGSEKILELLDDQLVAAGCMLRSPFAKALEGSVRAWRDKLNMLLHLLEELLSFQKWFFILRPIFSSSNIRQQLADESGRFAQLDDLWQQVLETILQRRLFLHVCESPLIFEEVPKKIQTMEEIMCSLINLLERKRSRFPRFYFLSNDELLQVLSHEQNPNELQYYLCKCFCGLHAIEFSKEGIVTGLWAEKSEYLPFFDPVHTFSRPVEEWMTAVGQEMKDTVTQAILERVKELHAMPSPDQIDKGLHVMTLSPSPRSSTRKFKFAPSPCEFKSGRSTPGVNRDQHSSFFNSVCQILAVGAYITYCSQVEKILSTEEEDPVKGLLLFSTYLSEEIEQSVSAVKSPEVADRQGTYKSLILLFVYFREIINRLVCGTQVGIESFEWQRSLRYYCQPSGDCQVAIMNQEQAYGCDLIDSHNRLVMTSLTEKCFLGMLYSFSLGLGCNVTGSSGVGKTETIKDCAKALGKHCIVIACSEEFDHQAIGNVLKGMASGGLWLCLTKFERLRPDVVSVLTQQLLSIQQAVATKALRFNYEGCGFHLNPRFAICTTSEPKCSGGYYGYLHKTRSCFRSACMILPDCNTVVQILLTAEGIPDSAGLAQKLTLCFRLASEQLSFEENHCDFGLRAMKAVVKSMSVLNFTEREQSEAANPALQQQQQGDIILCKTLQQYCLPRLVGDGYTLFSGLLADIFPDVQVPTLQEQRLQASIDSSLIERGLMPHQPLREKCMQLHGAMKVHRGVLIVGVPATGKTQCYTTLSHARNLMVLRGTNIGEDHSQKCKVPAVILAIVNPSAVSTSHLFGCANPKTQSWQEGIVPNILRESEERVRNGGATWMVLDGDMDSVWPEHVSTMLDDNGILCLSNSKRILLPRIENFSMLFEVESLKTVSPGIVSRCGIILMDAEDQEWKPVVDAWLERVFSPEVKRTLQKLFDTFLEPCLEVAMRRQDLPVVTVGLVSSLLSFLEVLLKLAGYNPTPDSVQIDEGTDLQVNRSKPKCEVKGNKIPAKSSLEKLGRVKQIIHERQKQVRDAVNWRRLHHRKFTSSYEGFRKDTVGVDENNRVGLTFEGVPGFYEAADFSAGSIRLSNMQELLIAERNLCCLFVFGVLWSVGGSLSSSDASQQFEKVVRDLSILYQGEMGPFPAGSMYDYYYDVKFNAWVTWEQFLVQVHSVSAESQSTFFSLSNKSSGGGLQLNSCLNHGFLYVSTPETLRTEFLAQSLLKQKRSVLLYGGMGSGKTTVSGRILHSLSASGNCQVVGVTLNSTSGGAALYDVIRPKLAIWRRRCLMPAVHGKMVIFVDDLNISQLHVRQEAPALQFLRYLFEQKGWFGLPMDATFTAVEGLVHLAAMSQLSSSVTPPLARLLRHFCILHSSDYCPSSLRSIFSASIIHHCQRLSNSSEVTDMVKLICEASVSLFFRFRMMVPTLVDQLPPLFTLHDLFRVQRRLLSGCLRNLTSSQSFYRLWAYEFTRVYCDRLRNEAHRKLVMSEIYASTQGIMKLSGEEPENYLYSLIDEEKQPLFGVFYREEKEGCVQTWSRYEEVACRAKWERAMSSLLASYSVEDGSQSPIVLFPGAVSHLSRLLNILKATEGHAVLLGYSGSGRSSLARLATYVLGYTLCEVQVNGSYRPEMWIVDLRNLLRTCSLRDTPTVFLIILEPDANLQDQIMEDLNLIVHCGEALELLGEEEKYYIHQELHRMQETSQVSNFESVLGSDREQYLNQCFVKRVKENLRLVICTETPSNRDTSNSSIFLSAVITRHFSVDYYDKWTPVALQAVARVSLADHEHVKRLSNSDLELITRACSMIHTTSNTIASSSPLKGSWRLVGMPSYHEMLRVFGRILARKGEEVDRLLKRLETGLQKLQSTRILVEDMQCDLEELLKRKERTNSDMDELLASISEEQVQMDKALEEVAYDERVAAGEAETCKKLAQDAQNQVQEVAPEVLTAIKQLSQLNKKDISELKSFTQPPPRLLTVLEALCVILKKEPKHIKHPPFGTNIETANSYWPVARELLSQVDFVKMLLSFNKDAMENSTMEKLKPYMENPLFKPEKVRRISVACRSICIWIRAMYNYHYAKTVKMEPRIEKLKIANHNLETCKDTLEEARRKLVIAEDNLKELQARYEEASQTKDGLAKKADESEVKLQRARRLIGRLDGECRRWSTRVDDLRTKRNNIVGDAVLASGLVAYLGSFPASFRSRFITEWQAGLQNIGLPYSSDFSLVTFYTTPQDIKAWAAAGLPTDDHSLENGIIVCNTSRPMLILDPQKQVSRWISSIEDPVNISIVDMNSPQVLQEAQACSLTNNLLMVESVGNQTAPGLIKKVTALTKAPNLTQLAQKERAVKRFLHCGCILLTYEQGFHYSDELNVCVSLNVVDFSITFHGLCSQLLSIAAEKERLDLEEERNHLLHQRLLLNCRLQEIEDDILTLLQGVMVTILDDEVLEEALSKATTTYADIQAKLVRAATTEAAVELTRKRHLPVAERAAILYSCIADVSTLESVYQWTLPWFKSVYSTSMQRTSALNPVDFDTRLDYLISKITIAVYRKICCGLLKKHQFLFGLLVIFRLAQSRHDVEQEEWLFLLQGDTGTHSSSSDKPCPPWLDASCKEWRQLSALSCFPRFEGLIEDLDRPCWQDFFQSRQSCTLPEPWPEKLGPFRSLLVLRCLRLDMVMDAVAELVKSQLRLRKEHLAELSVEDACDESSPEIPVTCIFQGVATPLDEIMTCAKRKNMLKRLRVFSLDQCQGPKLSDAVKEAATWGKWVVLQNCHANVPWINTSLRVILEEVKQKPVHESFRLWLTMVPTSGRPPYLLSDSVKIVVEPPKGVKRKILQTLKTQQADEIYFGRRTMRIEEHVAKHPRALFQLALFHALVQERASFGVIGWNIAMQLDHTVFNLAKAELIKVLDGCDLDTNGAPLKKTNKGFLERNRMESLQHLITRVIYGGYVMDTWDEHSLNQLFEHCFMSNFSTKSGSSVRSYLPRNKGTIDDFLKHASDLPEPDDPEVMGLQKDALLNSAERDVQQIFTEALTLESGKESFLAPLSCIFESKRALLLQCISELRPVVSASLDEPRLLADTHQPANPISLLLLQEVKRYNRLILVMGKSIAEATKEIETPGDMKSETERLCGSIIAGQALFSATLQLFARAKKVPLSSVQLDVIMTEEKVDKSYEEPEDGCYITGLHLEGARWDAEAEALAEAEGKYLSSSSCCLWLRPRTNVDGALRVKKSDDKDKHYSCPIYTTPARNGLKPCRGCNYVGTIDLPVGTRSAMHWALQGVALLCSSRD
ncbi:hypothetical protein R1sor_015564 [Riccia sorocarpa]|uniref:AAA+ ATPase domain-containing protein n=1 Tax=Riccia sorocarpa TaxID=122646 RepID=A0ABD3HGH9_9MARC